MISGIDWVDQCFFRLVIGCYEYHRPIITNIFRPKRFQKSLQPKPSLYPFSLEFLKWGMLPLGNQSARIFSIASNLKANGNFLGKRLPTNKKKNHNKLSLLALVYLY